LAKRTRQLKAIGRKFKTRSLQRLHYPDNLQLAECLDPMLYIVTHVVHPANKP
jgi:hypothetical protein